MRVVSLLLGAAIGMCGLVAAADPLPVPNGSFENPAIPLAPPYVGTPDNWDMGGFFQGSFLNVTGIANVDGNQLGYILSSGQFGESFSQVLTGQTYQAGKTYTLAAGVCMSLNSPLPTDTVSLALVYFDDQAMPHIVGSQLDISNDAGAGLTTDAMKEFSLSTGVVADPSIVGKEIGVRIWTTGTAIPGLLQDPSLGLYFDVDNVKVSVVPEPAALSGLAVASLALVRPRRRR